MIQRAAGASILIFLASSLSGQSASPPLHFEVASIKVHPDPPHDIGVYTSGNRLEGRATMVRVLISWAYDLKNYQLETPPAVVASTGDTMYDVMAKAEEDKLPTRPEFRQMLQELLTDRFKLRFHWEMRPMPVYELTIDKNGPLLKPSSGESECASRIGPVHPEDRNYRYQFTNCTLSGLVGSLQADRPILDKTGLTGRYDITIFATPDFKLRNSSEPGDVSALDAVRQLGLKLEPKKDNIEVMMVDHVEKPSGN